MNKEKESINLPVVILSIIGGITLILMVSFIYLSLNGKNYTSIYNQKLENGEIRNPIKQFQLAFADDSEVEIPEGSQIIVFNTTEGEKRIILQTDLGDLNINDIQKELVNYLSVVLKFYNLHKIPFTSITPKVQVYFDDVSYYVEVIKGDIFLKEGETYKPDITLKTDSEEIFKIIEDYNYVEESIASGKSSIELTTNYLILFFKGYYSLYKEFSGWNLTSKVILSTN